MTSSSSNVLWTRRWFGTLRDGHSVDAWTLRSNAMEVTLTEYGATIIALRVPDRTGRWGDVILGHDSLSEYVEQCAYLGAVVGRYANRISAGRFVLDGRTHQLTLNEGPNHLHGGVAGFDRQHWKGTGLHLVQGAGVTFRRISPSGEQGYPGAVAATITYVVDPENVLWMRYEATTDAATPINLTQHSYFNLSGDFTTTVLDHELTIHADRYLPVSDGLIPTGQIAPVADTPFDFRAPQRIGGPLGAAHEQLRLGGGFDHNLVLAEDSRALKFAARLRDPRSGRTLDIRTTEPGVQFYGGQLLDTGKGRPFKQRFCAHAGLCLETQHYPDSPNQPHFPTTILRPGYTYRSMTSWTFTAS